MKLIIIYGAPAAGKLTIAKELAAIADVKVFDNHQVIDIIEPIVTRSYPDFAKLIYSTQSSIINAAVSANQKNVVITFPYAANLERDAEFINDITNKSRSKGSSVYPIFLHCDADTLRSRAIEESRKQYGKITTVETMNKMIDKYEFKIPLDIEGNVIFNTDTLSAKDVAAEIKKLAQL